MLPHNIITSTNFFVQQHWLDTFRWTINYFINNNCSKFTLQQYANTQASTHVHRHKTVSGWCLFVWLVSYIAHTLNVFIAAAFLYYTTCRKIAGQSKNWCYVNFFFSFYSWRLNFCIQHCCRFSYKLCFS